MKRIGVTLGDPAGVGPDVLAQALHHGGCPPDVALIVAGTESIFRARTVMAGVGERIEFQETGHPSLVKKPGLYWVESPCDEKTITGGNPTESSTRAAFSYLERVAGWARDAAVDALVTGPVSKARMAGAGLPFAGHTEYFAAQCGARHAVMLFVGAGIRVALVTTHASIRRVPGMITAGRILETIRVTAEAMAARFAVAAPRVGVLGLNPHAGDGGLFGNEEADIIAPAVKVAKERGVNAEGPLPADTVFRRARAGEFDVLVAMYHDQALPVVKTLADDAVNVTLGLPIVRTSPDHGPAYDKVGHGGIRWEPTRAAIDLAAALIRPQG